MQQTKDKNALSTKHNLNVPEIISYRPYKCMSRTSAIIKKQKTLFMF